MLDGQRGNQAATTDGPAVCPVPSDTEGKGSIYYEHSSYSCVSTVPSTSHKAFYSLLA